MPNQARLVFDYSWHIQEPPNQMHQSLLSSCYYHCMFTIFFSKEKTVEIRISGSKYLNWVSRLSHAQKSGSCRSGLAQNTYIDTYTHSFSLNSFIVILRQTACNVEIKQGKYNTKSNFSTKASPRLMFNVTFAYYNVYQK